METWRHGERRELLFAQVEILFNSHFSTKLTGLLLLHTSPSNTTDLYSSILSLLTPELESNSCQQLAPITLMIASRQETTRTMERQVGRRIDCG